VQKTLKSDRTLLPLLLGLVVLTSVAVLFPESREWLRDHLLPDSREILAKAEGDLTGQGDFISVVKVKTKNDLVIEIYSVESQKNETTQRARLILPERKDGFFEFRGQPTNLALVDLNGDGILEIVAPTFDDNLIPRLRIYRYDPSAQVFILTGPEFLPMEPQPAPQ
jgi:hypothetical protein